MSLRPDLLAGKLESGDFDVSEFENHPRLRERWRELLWFIQAAAIPHGGLKKLVQSLLTHDATRFGTASMRDAGPPVDGRYSTAQCLAAWKTFDSKLATLGVCRFNVAPHEYIRTRVGDPERFEDFLSMHYSPHLTVEMVERGEDCDRAAVLAGVESFNWTFLNDLCLSRFGSAPLESFLVDLCTLPGSQFVPPWWCADLFDLLLDEMDRRAASILAGIAQTEVTRKVFRELEFSITQNVPVPLVGESRIGKTSSVSVWCAMRPGRTRLVTVPESNRERDFIRAHADAFGLDYNPSTTLSKLKWEVEYVHRHSGLFIAYEESQFLVPVKYSKASAPARIEWVRNQVIDRGLGCAFLATPQSYHQTLDQFVRTTGYKIEQWLGRLAPAVVLPADLSPEDVLAVAKLHFPDWHEPYLQLIAARAMISEGYLKAVEMTARRARFLAQECGHDRVQIEDVRQAIEDMMPSPATGTGAAAPQPRRTASAVPARTTRAPIAAAPPPAGRRAAVDTFPVHNERVNRAPERANEMDEAAA